MIGFLSLESDGKIIKGILRVEQVLEYMLMQKSKFRLTLINSDIQYLLEVQDRYILRGSELSDCCLKVKGTYMNKSCMIQ